jgi:TolA-binding protein
MEDPNDTQQQVESISESLQTYVPDAGALVAQQQSGSDTKLAITEASAEDKAAAAYSIAKSHEGAIDEHEEQLSDLRDRVEKVETEWAQYREQLEDSGVVRFRTKDPDPVEETAAVDETDQSEGQEE